MRRLLPVLLTAILLAGLMPLQVLAAAPVASDQAVTVTEDTATPITLTGSDPEFDELTYTVTLPGPEHGTLEGTAPNLTYTPDENYNGPDSFTFTAGDASATSDPGTVTIQVTAVNDPPVCTGPFASSGDEDTAQGGTLGCTDIDSPSLTYAAGATNVAHGARSVAANGAWTYTPDENYNGPDSFTFTASDGSDDSAEATVSITVTAVNDPPVASAQSVTTHEDTAKAITLIGSDVVEKSAVTFEVVGDPAHGTLSGTAPDLTYTPAAHYNGSDSFTFRVNDGLLNSATAKVSITVSPVNDAPLANAQSVATNEDTAKAITLAGTDVEGSQLTYAVGTGPLHGTLSGTAPDLTYTPATHYNGPDNFTFRVNDGASTSDPATVSIAVSAVNDQPACSPLVLGTNKNLPVNGTVSCADVDDPSLTLRIGTGPVKGSVAPFNTTTGAFTYTPNTAATGSDSFTVIASDGAVDSLPVIVDITIGNHAPVAEDQAVSTGEDAAKAITLVGSDLDLDALTFAIVARPVHGTLSTSTGAAQTYTPAANYSGPDSFTFRISDGLVDSNTATVTITVTAVNDAPIANAQSVATDEDTAMAITLAGTDVEGSQLTYAIVTGPAHGLLSGTGAARTYTPDENYNGADSFTFRVNDGTVDSATATVSITVSPVNDAPVASAQAVTTNEDTAGVITLAGSDPDGSPLTYALVTRPTHGNLSGTVPNLTYTPTANYYGPDSLTFRVSDGSATSADATVWITVSPVNDAPEARTDGFTVNATTTATLAVLANDYTGPTVSGNVSEPTDTVTIKSVGTASRGALSIAAGGTGVVYDPTGCGTGGDSFAYTITDSHGLTATATAFVTIARPGANGLSVNPITNTPATGLVSNSTIGSTVPLRLSWCGVTKTGASVRSYKVAQSTNGGSTYPTTLYSSTAGTGSTRNLAVNTTYRWRARTVDSAGRTGSYRYSSTSRVARYQENSAAITYSGTWGTTKSTSYSGGAQRYTGTAGAAASITLTNARQFAIVGPRSSTRGSFQVYVDGVLVATVSEKASTTVYRRVLYVRSLTTGTNVNHTIQVKAVGNGRIDLDAILALY